jgi:hypothetical protein
LDQLKFEDPTKHNYHPKSESPARDFGSDNGDVSALPFIAPKNSLVDD